MPLVSPVMVQEKVAASVVHSPPIELVTVYPVIGLPPSQSGTPQERVTRPSPATAVTALGAFGGRVPPHFLARYASSESRSGPVRLRLKTITSGIGPCHGSPPPSARPIPADAVPVLIDAGEPILTSRFSVLLKLVAV